MRSIDGVRARKKVFSDQGRLASRRWLAANMSGEALLGFGAFNTKKVTGTDVIDFVKLRPLVARAERLDGAFFEQVLGKPKG